MGWASFTVLDARAHRRTHCLLWARRPVPVAIPCSPAAAGGVQRDFRTTERLLIAIAALPADTRVYCAHEYNAGHTWDSPPVEPAKCPACSTQGLRPRSACTRRADGPVVSRRGTATNPFMRTDQVDVIAAASAQGRATEGRAEACALRTWKTGAITIGRAIHFDHQCAWSTRGVQEG